MRTAIEARAKLNRLTDEVVAEASIWRSPALERLAGDLAGAYWRGVLSLS
ncbi:MAG: hypothetical protein WB783_15650 [Arenicellales bacterium]